MEVAISGWATEALTFIPTISTAETTEAMVLSRQFWKCLQRETAVTLLTRFSKGLHRSLGSRFRVTALFLESPALGTPSL